MYAVMWDRTTDGRSGSKLDLPVDLILMTFLTCFHLGRTK